MQRTTMRERLRQPWTIFWVGFALRVAVILIGHTYHIRSEFDHFNFGFEAGRIGRSLATGQGYSSPFNGPSGPTAWLPPLYPLLLARGAPHWRCWYATARSQPRSRWQCTRSRCGSSTREALRVATPRRPHRWRCGRLGCGQPIRRHCSMRCTGCGRCRCRPVCLPGRWWRPCGCAKTGSRAQGPKPSKPELWTLGPGPWALSVSGLASVSFGGWWRCRTRRC
jgi:hypothetical protein